MAVNVTIQDKTIVRVLAVALFFLIAIEFLQALLPALTLVFVAAFLAIALNPPVTYIAGKLPRGNRLIASAIAYLTVIGVIGILIWALVPPLLSQTDKIIDKAPEFIEQIKDGDNVIGNFVNEYSLDKEIQDGIDSLSERVSASDGPILGSIGKVGHALVSLITVLVLTFLMLIEGPSWLEKFWEVQPEKKREHRKMLVQKMYEAITGYVNGQLLIAFLASLTSLGAMLIAGVPFAFPLAGVVGVSALIPLVGATLGAVVVVTVATFTSVWKAMAMAIFFLVYQQIENAAIQPVVQARKLELTPLLVFIAVIFGVAVGGILGALVAIPIAAIVRILFMDYSEQKQILARHKKTKTKTKKSKTT